MFDQVRSLARGVRYSGMLHPVRPDRAARLWLPYRRYGPVPATLGAMAALRFPRRTAVIDERGTLTYAELEARAAALAGVLRARLAGGERTGVLCRNHRGFVTALLAASRLGNDVVLLNTEFSAAQLGEVLRRERVGALVHDDEFGSVLDGASYDGHRLAAEPPERPAADAPRPARPSRVIILTSGTTGAPKGARHDISLRALLPVTLTHVARVPLRSGRPVVVAAPLFHVLGLAYCAAALAMGAPLMLQPRFDPAAVLDAVERHRAWGLVAVPVMVRRILDAAEGPQRGSLRVVVCGGSALHPHLSTAFMDSFGDVLHNVYGATETGWATISTPRDLREAPGTVGRPSLGVTIKVVDPGGADLPPGETGEIYTGGGLRFAGYTGGGGRPTRDGLVGTGDLGHFDAAGRLFIDGRADDMIISGGENVFPGEVEDVLGAHPGVAEVSVTGADDEKFGQRLVAHVVRTEGGEVTEDDLKEHVRSRLARFKVPRDITFVPELPRTITGKVKRRELPD